MIQITVLLFAKLREVLGKGQAELKVPAEATVRDALRILVDEKKARCMEKSLMFAIDQSYVSADTILKDGDELALIPPVSGG